MALSSKQRAALAACVLVLADPAAAEAAADVAEAAADKAGAAAPAGQTIAQKAAGLHGQGAPPKKVASGKGEAFYHLPIGSLIIPHPGVPDHPGPHGGPHFVQGEPSHEVQGNISQAQWQANQWKKVLDEGTHKEVQANGKSYAVHKDAKLWVPKDTDLSNEAEVKNVGKVAQFGEPHQEGAKHAVLTGGASPSEWPHTEKAHQALESAYKPLPEGAAATPPGKVNVGGIAVGKDEIHSAIQHLSAAKSTNVKGPLKVKSHPLAAMDYMAVSKEELAKHPELKVPKGTKKEHVGQVKLAVLHHLAGRAAHLEHTEAQAKIAAEAQAKALADAQHAQEMAPAVTEAAGPPANKEQLAEAIAILEPTVNTHASFKAPLKAKGNPLASWDYMAAAKLYKQQYPGLAKDKSTKQILLEVLKAHYASLAAVDKDTGYDDAAEIHDLLVNGFAKTKKPGDHLWASATILQMAAQNDHNAYAWKNPAGWQTSWTRSAFATDYLKATPQHRLFSFTEGSAVPYEYGKTFLWNTVHLYIAPGGAGKPGTAAAKDAETKPGTIQAGPVPPVIQQGYTAVFDPEWKASQAYKDLHEAIGSAQAQNFYLSPELGTFLSRHMAKMLWLTSAVGERYLVPKEDGTWNYAHKKPEQGSWGAQTSSGWYAITPDHQVVHYAKDGMQTILLGEHVLEMFHEGVKPLEALQGLQDKALQGLQDKLGTAVQVWMGGNKVASLPAGSKVYTGKAALDPSTSYKYAKLPSGVWHVYDKWHSGLSGTHDYDAEVATGSLVPVTGPAAEGKVQVVIDNIITWWAPPGSKVWKGFSGRYVQEPGGNWKLVEADGTVHDSDMPLRLHTHIMTGYLRPDNSAAEEYAKAIGAATHESLPGDSADLPIEQTPDVEVKIQGKVHNFPAGSQVYHLIGDSITPENASVKYVHTPEGAWHNVYADASTLVPDNYTHLIGSSITPDKPTTEEPQLQPEASYSPSTGPGIPAILKNKVVGYFPAGSVLYKKPGGGYASLIAKAPDGTWYYATSVKVNKDDGDGYAGDKFLAGQNPAVEVPPPTEADVAHIDEVDALRKLLNTGAVEYPAAVKSGYLAAWPTWQIAMVHALSVQSSYDVRVAHSDGGYISYGSLKTSDEEHWSINAATFEGYYYPPGEQQKHDISFKELKQAVAQHLVPDAVSIEGKIYHFGYYASPKSTGAYLQIKASPHTYLSAYMAEEHKAVYIWHAVNGNTKEITAEAAAKQLEKATKYTKGLPELKPLGPLKKNAYAATVQPGSFKLWTVTGKISANAMEIYSDGSGVFSQEGASDASADAVTVQSLVQAGALLDEYGTTVVQPGTQPEAYHIFGTKSKSKAELEQLLKNLETLAGLPAWSQEFIHFIGGTEQTYFPPEQAPLAVMFFSDKLNGSSTGDGQYTAVTGLVRELLQVPALPAGIKLGAVEPVYLKGLPEGIKTSHDVFKWTPQGTAEKFSGQYPGNLGTKAGPDKETLGNKIDAVSFQFGKGKVVGTHLASMSAAKRTEWLKAWQAGDMVQVFKLDASGGKVSPAHPGAPGNPDTHHIIWAPYDPSQVPAVTDIPGEWTDMTHATPIKAEIANYLIKVGLQHAEYLSDAERHNFVGMHRQHSQDIVDTLTRTAQERFELGVQPVSLQLKWTEGVKPAHTYDSFVENSKPASEWPSGAAKDFFADNAAELAPFKAKFAADHKVEESYVDQYYSHEVIQAWMDNVHAKYVAEQSVPVWKEVPTGALPSHGHPIKKLVSTIPYTGAETTWFFKPGLKPFRTEQEHAANRIGRLLGFRSASSEIITFNGETGQAQRVIEGEPLGHYTDLPPWHEFTPVQVADIAQEHMLDWVLSDDDSSSNAFISQPDGHLTGIDKGRSWGNLDWPGLAGDSSMDTMTGLAYTALYDAIRSHELSKETADQAYVAVVQHARKIAKVPDASVRVLLEEAFAHRPESTWGKYGGKEGLITEILRRKNNLEQDFAAMWAKIYDQAGFGGSKVDPHAEGEVWGPAAGHATYGVVTFNTKGEVLLREPLNHWGEYHWTFAKGGQVPGESTRETALRETTEETGFAPVITGYVPGGYGGDTSNAYFYLGTDVGSVAHPEMDNGETASIKWATPAEAAKLLATSENEHGVKRDLAILKAAVAAYKAKAGDITPLEKQGPLPVIPVQLLPDGPAGAKLFSGFSEPDYMEHVAASKSHGYPAFFGGTHVRDAHALVWREFMGSGTEKPRISGEVWMRGSGYDKVTKWLKAHYAGAVSSETDTAVVYPGGEDMPGRAPDSSPDRGGVSGEKGWFNVIITAGRSVSRHAVDKKFNAASMAALDLLAKSLNELDGSTKPSETNVLSAIAHYQNLIGKVNYAKNTSGTFGPGSLPRWVSPDAEKEPEPEPSTVKVEMRTQKRFLGEGEVAEDGEHHTSLAEDTAENPGNVYRVTLPGGEVIDVGDGSSNSIAKAHHGRVRFTAVAQDGAASLERIRGQLQAMGLAMPEATPEDLELYYWRHLYGILQERKDNGSYDYQNVRVTVGNALKALGKDTSGDQEVPLSAMEDAGLPPAQELDIWHKAWATIASSQQVEDWVDRGGTLPRLAHLDPHSPQQLSGKPFWYRFDMTKEQISKFPFLIKQSGNSEKAAPRTIHGGGIFSKDALWRVWSMEADGMSNPPDRGATGFVFLRIKSSSTGTGAALVSPKMFARTQNYGWDGDEYGDTKYRASMAAFKPEIAASWTDSSNETMVKDVVSLLDDIEILKVENAAKRAELINELHALGISSIRGLPVEKRLVSSLSTGENTIREHYKEHPELLDPLYEYSGNFEYPTPASAGQAASSRIGALPTEPAEPAGPATEPDVFVAPFAYDGVVVSSNGVEVTVNSQVHDFQIGSKVYQYTGSTSPMRLVRTPAGNWWLIYEDGTKFCAGEDHTYDDYLKDNALEEVYPGVTAEDTGADVTVTVGSNMQAFPAGSVVYMKADQAAANSQTRWVKTPGGQWYSVTVVGPGEPVGSLDLFAEEGKLLKVPESHLSGVKVTVSGKVHNFPVGSKVYKLVGEGSSRYVLKPDGSWWLVTTPDGQALPTSTDHSIWVKNGTLVPA